MPDTGLPQIPGVPDYQGSAGTPASGTVGSAAAAAAPGGDIWQLGDYYGQPILLGADPVPTSRLQDYREQVPEAGRPEGLHWGTTQDFEAKVQRMYANQAAERKKNPDQLTEYEQFQRALYSAGAYGQTAFDKIHTGQWDAATADALKSAFASYVQVAKGGKTPTTFADFLQMQAAGNGDGGFFGQDGQGAKAPAPPAINLADPTAIRAAAQSAFQQALGRGASESELSSFVSSFQAMQTADQGSLTQTNTTPDLQGQAMATAQNVDPAAYQAQQGNAYTNALLNMFLPSESARANEAPTAAA